MDASITYMSQDVVDTFVAVIFSTMTVLTIMLSAMAFDSWLKKRKKGG